MTSSTSSNAVPEWTVLYHSPGTLKGRGEFLRLMLEDAGVAYLDSGDGLYGPQGSMDMFRGSPALISVSDDISSQPFPVLYPPAIWHRPSNGDDEQVFVNQVGACMEYLGEALGYAPKSAKERAQATSITLNALDYIGEGRSTFHPVQNHASYKDQKEEADEASKEFSKDRMLKYLAHFDKIVKKAGLSNPVAGGSGVTYADFCLFHVLDASVHQFNTDFYEHAWDAANVPALKEFYEHFKKRPNLQAYWKSGRAAPYAGDSMM
ncbi:hypothetical protein MPSEU_000338800 [Mayamaea pseudoterrestris]|nr:hypothetical protein MPSEU_000338800 [Mayamaea pseudoterrestris]